MSALPQARETVNDVMQQAQSKMMNTGAGKNAQMLAGAGISFARQNTEKAKERMFEGSRAIKSLGLWIWRLYTSKVYTVLIIISGGTPWSSLPSNAMCFPAAG